MCVKLPKKRICSRKKGDTKTVFREYVTEEGSGVTLKIGICITSILCAASRYISLFRFSSLPVDVRANDKKTELYLLLLLP